MTFTVKQSGWSGQKTTDCETVAEVWDVIGDGDFGGLYEVTSDNPEDDVDQFIPF